MSHAMPRNVCMFLIHGKFWGNTAKAWNREAAQLRPVDGGEMVLCQVLL